MVTGIIGAVTGIAGSIMDYIAYRRSNEIKKSDRRLDLHKLRNDAHIAGAELLDLLQNALTSREAIMSALGGFRSSTMQQYTSEHTRDFLRAK